MIRISFFLLAFLCLFCTSLQAQEVVPAFETKARNAILIDGKSGEVFFEKDADTAVPPASMSKMMLQSIVFDMLKSGDLKDDQEFITSVDAWKRGGGGAGGSTMWLEPNKPARIIDLLRGAVIQSANDACLSLAEGIAGSESAFLEKMRAKAEKLGLKNSQFRNVTGLPDPEHKMSVRDLSTLARHIIYEHPDRYPLYGERSFTWNKITQENRNPLLKDYVGADGMKTGYTKEAGYGLVGSVQRDGRRLIMVVAGLETLGDRKLEAQRLLDWGFRQFKTMDVFEAGEIVSKARVWGGAEQFVDLQVDSAFQVALTPLEQKTVEMKLSYKGPLIAPVKGGEQVGTARVLVKGKVVSEVPVTTAKDVGAVDSIWRKALDSMLIMVLGG
jgi:serine-type D-Ala-D-Ala carboxypeptidase (penicillin-binding protein 5/6)